MLTLENCQISFNNACALSINSLSIDSQGVTVVIGANGSGKTLLLKLLAGLLNTDEKPNGKIIYNPELTYPEKTWVSHTPALLNRSVYDNIALPLYHQKSYKKEVLIDQRVTNALKWADIEALSNKPASILSTGQQQLVALARAWALSPKLLLLDEPCANLDPKRQQHMEFLIQELNSNGCKIVMSTHQLSQAQRLASDIIFLDQGKILVHTDNGRFFDKEALKQQWGKDIVEPVYDFLNYH